MTSCKQIIASSAAAFGTSGVRGLVEELNDATCFAYTLAFLDHLKREHGLQPEKNIWIGHDLRPSSPRIANACIEAVRSAGLTPVFCSEVPTPALAFAAQQEQAPAIMITGSHIPFDRNGVKFYRADGEMMKEDEAPVINSVADFPDQLFEENSLAIQITDQPISDKAKELWKQRYAAAFPNLLDGMRIGHYQHSAAGRDLLAEILQSLGAEVVPLGRSDEFIPIDTEAVSESDKIQARKWREEHNLDALISTDGDGDRPLLADENGDYFRGDMLGILAAIGLGANTVATPVSTNTALEKSQKFSTVARTKIGSPHVIAAMQEAAKNADADADAIVVGFEPNGGFLMATPMRSPSSDAEIDRLPTRDALLPVLATISLSKQLDTPLSALAKTVPQRSTASDRLENTPTEDSKNFIALMKENVEQAAFLTPENAAPSDVNDLDGLRLTFPSGDIVHLRPSGNAPELRIYVESDSDEAAAALMGHAKPAVVQKISEFTSA